MSTRRQRKEARDAQLASDGAHSAAASAALAMPASAAQPASASAADAPRKRKGTADAAVVKSEPAVASSASSKKKKRTKKAKTGGSSSGGQESEPAMVSVSARGKGGRSAAAAAAADEEKDADERELEAFLFGGASVDEAMMRAAEEEEAEAQAAAAAASAPKHHRSSSSSAPSSEQPSGALFQIDTLGALAPEGGGGEGEEAEQSLADVKTLSEEEAAAAAAAPAVAPAWVDEDDVSAGGMVDLSGAARLRKLKKSEKERFITREEYSRRLRAVYAELNPGASSWATLPSADSASDADLARLLLQSTSGSLLAGSASTVTGRAPGGAARGEPLPSGQLELVRMKDANLAQPSQSVVSSVRFHSAGQLLFTAGLDKMVRLFAVDGVDNHRVAGVWLEDMPIMSAAWLPSRDGKGSSNEIVASGRRNHFYSIDVATNAVSLVPRIKGRDERSLERMVVSPDGRLIAFLGNDGYILLVSGESKQLVGTLKQNVSVRAISFSPDSSLLFGMGGEGLVYIWDVASRKCLYKHVDEGNNSATAIAIDQAGRGFYATGSDSGVVNLYNTQQISDRISSSSSSSGSRGLFSSLGVAPPPPLKSFMHLTTPIDSLCFNSDAQLLLASSRRTKDALKLIHVDSQTVFANWPTSSTPLHYVTAMDFSPNSGYMAIGNDRGRVLLYRLTHYPRA